MNFRMASGLTGLMPTEVRRWPVVNVFFGSRELREPDLQLKTFIANLGITAIVADARDPRLPEWRQLLATLGIAPDEIDGVLFYRIPTGVVDQYPKISGIEAEQRADRARFETMISATDAYL